MGYDYGYKVHGGIWDGYLVLGGSCGMCLGSNESLPT